MSWHWYIHHLAEAAYLERIGNLPQAIARLDKAKHHETGEEELRHLAIWRARLVRELAAKKGEG